MKLATLFRLTALLAISATLASAQADTSRIPRTVDTAIAPGGGSASSSPVRPWYDTLTVTQPRYARTTPLERLALAAFTAVALPVGATIGVITLLPPSINVISEDGKYQTGFAISSGVGFGGDTSEVIYFSDFRVQLEGAYFPTRRPGPMVRASLLFDQPLIPIHKRKFFWFGTAAGAGVSTDFEMVSPYAEGWIGLLNPMGIRFLTLFPQHNYGIRGRAGYNFATRKPWYEISLSATSTFWK